MTVERSTTPTTRLRRRQVPDEDPADGGRLSQPRADRGPTCKPNAVGRHPVPEPCARPPPRTRVVTTQMVADGVWYLTGGSHHSVAIEMKDHVIVVEAPLNDQRALAVVGRGARPGRQQADPLRRSTAITTSTTRAACGPSPPRASPSSRTRRYRAFLGQDAGRAGPPSARITWRSRAGSRRRGGSARQARAHRRHADRRDLSHRRASAPRRAADGVPAEGEAPESRPTPTRRCLRTRHPRCRRVRSPSRSPTTSRGSELDRRTTSCRCTGASCRLRSSIAPSGRRPDAFDVQSGGERRYSLGRMPITSLKARERFAAPL